MRRGVPGERREKPDEGGGERRARRRMRERRRGRQGEGKGPGELRERAAHTVLGGFGPKKALIPFFSSSIPFLLPKKLHTRSRSASVTSHGPRQLDGVPCIPQSRTQGTRPGPGNHGAAAAQCTVLFEAIRPAPTAHLRMRFLSQRPAPKLGRQKLSHLRVFWHDIVSGRNPTAVPVAQAAVTNTSRTSFGMVVMIDDPLTEGPEMSTNLVGRAQGMYASASQEELGLMMAMNFAFTEGKYNGSTITILGRNTVFSKVREMPVIGGSGLFRFATGYCQARTHMLDLRTGDAVVEYNLFSKVPEMARLLPATSPHLPAIAFGATLLCFVAAGKPGGGGFLVSEGPAPKPRPQRLSHFHFYYHDIVFGRNPTAVKIVDAVSANATTDFGMVAMIDDPLTEGPEVSSKLVGRAQGMYSSTSQTESVLLMTANFVFLEGEYNGSAVTIMGRYRIPSTVREMPVVGGSGLFRFARGYSQASTIKYNAKTGNALVEYNLYPRGFLVSQRPAPKLRQQKLSHFRFFFHEIVSGRSPTAVPVVRAPPTNASTADFGMVVMIDNPLTAGPEVSSKLVGRAQGMYTSASQNEQALLMAMNLLFLEGKYNGSSVAILGRNNVFLDVREMPVVGGSGRFRFAGGYCQARSLSFDVRTGDAVVEYNLYVLHN
ncbi:hypothetical protein Taro_022186 [Colocasia esculenta]|uniref:Dirigent protein n=1 Tax=Colocasia esculenta TaxID=4460 RepID=A0A843V0R8_COLES|nr:hypothetical protein [Colocasia esculenta]